MIDRRGLVGGGALLTLLGGAAAARSAGSDYGSVGKIRAKPGQGAALALLMLAATGKMPGCRAYIVAVDETDADLLWVFEAWDTKAAHDASLSLPAVRAVIGKARPLIAGFEAGAELRVLGGLR